LKIDVYNVCVIGFYTEWKVTVKTCVCKT